MKKENTFTKLMADFGRNADYWETFREADKEGAAEVRATYARLALVCSGPADLVNLCVTLDALFDFHANIDIERAKIYYDLWRKADRWAAQVLTDKELEEYYKIDYVARLAY